MMKVIGSGAFRKNPSPFQAGTEAALQNSLTAEQRRFFEVGDMRYAHIIVEVGDMHYLCISSFHTVLKAIHNNELANQR